MPSALPIAAEGNPLSRSRYDPFGSVVETEVWDGSEWTDRTTTPISETDHLYLSDLLERDLNLYFTADGWYYDRRWRFG